MHTRQKIRDAIFSRLEAHPDLATVFNSRAKAADEDDLPFADILTGSEISEDYSDQWSELRTVQVHVVLYARNYQGVADQLDSLAEVVEALLGSDNKLGGICQSFRYKGCDPDYESAASLEAAMLTLNYECQYIWEPSPELDYLETVSLAFDMASPRNDPQNPATPDGQEDASVTIAFNNK